MTPRENIMRLVFVAIPLVGLLVSFIAAVVVPAPGATSIGWIAAASAMAAAWEIVWFAIPTMAGREPPALILYIVGFLAAAAVLVVMQPWFGFFAWGVFLRAPLLSSRSLRTATTVAGAAIMALAQVGGGSNLHGATLWIAWPVLSAANAAIAVAMIAMATRGRIQEHEDAKRIHSLAVANRRLEEAIAENERLRDELVAQARAAGIASERTRMAGEIHDTIAQGLAGVVTQLEAAQHSRGDELDRHLALARELARDSLAEARRSVKDLQPAPLATGRLADAVESLAAEWRKRTDAAIEVNVTGERAASTPDVEVGIYRTAQESLANAVRHADAGRVNVTLSYLGDEIVLDVRDDGTGFDPEHPPSSPGGFGIAAMRERLSRIGGRLEIESAAGRGTTVTAIVPRAARRAAG